jgi:small redox-active disulfide protein 2
MGSLKIEVIGPGCRFCKKLHALVNEVVTEKGIDAEVVYVTELKKVIRYVPFTPILIINGEVAHRGKFLPSKDKLEALIREKAQ